MGGEGLERTEFSPRNGMVVDSPGTESGTVPPGLADLVKLMAGLTPSQVSALVTLAQSLAGSPEGEKGKRVIRGKR